jgi:hypothetical protein
VTAGNFGGTAKSSCMGNQMHSDSNWESKLSLPIHHIGNNYSSQLCYISSFTVMIGVKIFYKLCCLLISSSMGNLF